MLATIEIPTPANGGEVDTQYIREGVAALLYYNGKLSGKEACEMLGIRRRQFEEVILPRFGLSVVGGTPEDVAFELNSI